LVGRAVGEVWLIVEYEYARRRYAWSKRLNWVAMLLAVGIGVAAFVWGLLNYLDWVWLSEHFPPGSSTRWTQDKINGYLVTAVLMFAVGGLGIVAFLLGFLKVRKALDEDNQDAIKRWTLLTGIIGALPSAALGALLEFFIWRAHVSEKFTIFGLLGRAPEPPPEPPSAMAVAQQQAAQDEARRKDEYMALFGAQQKTYKAPSANMAPSAAPEPSYEAPAASEAAPQEAYEAPQAPEPATTTYHDQPSGAPICTCGRPMEWIAEYGRYYCYTDDRYEGEA
jgi:hypothetical protein